ncbi:UbiD family decarboxylase [Bradyrhizobium sp. dw_78]|uniref:UbiD family decarboxylase n=1 Tax=Bradyrhizobium sp. dw_78 TaxID=2719793 RepID=UPI001BD5D527|nr:UbiD family decarboxylase [Bradyrhizobium sp. dw_78]
MPVSDILDTRFRSALLRLAQKDRVLTYDRAAAVAGRAPANEPADPHLEVAAILKKLDGRQALLFPSVIGYETPVIGNLLSSRENCEAAFGLDFNGIRGVVQRAMGSPIPPKVVTDAPVHEVVMTSGFDIRKILPALFHAPGDAGRYVTAGIVVVKDPVTGIYNASYHRLQLLGPDRVAIKLDFGRHLRLAFERAKARGEALPVAVCIGTDLALHFTAATMGSQMPETADELAVAGGLAGQALTVVKAVSQDLLVPAESEFVLEGKILVDQVAPEGPFGEFIGFAAPAADAPVLQFTAVTQRKRPIYHVINGFGRETIILRKYVLEASLLKVLQSAVPIVTDVEMTSGGLHRFHAVIQVKKQTRQHNGLQRNAMMAAFGALKDLDLITMVDHDIDIRDPIDVEYAIATRMEASSDLILIPGARGHEYVRVSKDGIRTKLGIDATVPFEDQAKFRRVEFAETNVDAETFTSGRAAALRALDVAGIDLA